MGRLFGIGGLVFGLGVVALYLVVNWSGHREWREVEAALTARGEPLTMADLVPGPVDPDENFAFAPVFAEIFAKPKGERRLDGLVKFVGQAAKGDSRLAGYARAVEADFGGSDEEAARVVLAEVALEEDVWDEIRAAALRPRTAWPADYTKGVAMNVDQVIPLLSLGQSLDAQARARVVLGRGREAMEDVLLLLNFADRTSEPSNLITHLVSCSLVGIAVGVVEFGIDSEAWAEDELRRISTALGEIDLLVSLQNGLRGERAAFLDVMRGTGRRGLRQMLEESVRGVMAENITVPHLWWILRPSGFNGEDRARYSQLMQRVIDAAAMPGGLPATADEVSGVVEIAGAGKVDFFRTPATYLAMDAIARIPRRTTYWATKLDLAVAACAIERFRRREGRLPEVLAELGADVPGDPMSGGDLRYRLADGERGYLLYSVGWDQEDDGGSGARADGERSEDATADWVW